MIGAKITSKGQVTIPERIRDELGLKPGDRVLFVIRDGEVALDSQVDEVGSGSTVLEAQFGKESASIEVCLNISFNQHVRKTSLTHHASRMILT